VKQILLKGDRAIGVVLESGEEIHADTVVSAADAKHTFLDMLPAGSLPNDFERAIRNFKFRGSSAKVNFALDGLPTFTAAPPGYGHLLGTVSISPSPDYMEKAYDDAKHGHPSHRPFLDMLIPTLVDPSMAPPGKHVATAFVQYAPHKLAAEHGTWDDIKESFGDLVVDTISEFAPDFRNKIVGRQIMTPLDLERTIGLTEGNIFQGEILVQQMAFNRPVSGWARYKTPIKDYWLASSSAHPGGGIMGAPGRLAALEILKSKAGEK
jgi:phytoene dehydrogenase-like protein